MAKNSNTTALITGASSGIGLELAKLFASDGVNLVLVARREKELHQLQQHLQSEHGVGVTSIVCDLSENSAPRRVYEEVKAKGVPIDYLVNNAGVGDFGLFSESDWHKDQQMLDLNIKALTELTHLYIPDMISNGYGRILNIASTASFQPGPLMAVYYATKAYVLSFSEAIANELKDTGLTVTALCPGPTESGFLKAAAMEGIRLIDKRQLPSSQEVAECGYHAMMKGQTVAIHGWLNYLMANANRLFPRALVTKVVRMIMEKQ